LSDYNLDCLTERTPVVQFKFPSCVYSIYMYKTVSTEYECLVTICDFVDKMGVYCFMILLALIIIQVVAIL